jgi:hypothetical protein
MNFSLNSHFSFYFLIIVILFRRKPGRITDYTDDTLSTGEVSTTLDDDHHRSSKCLLISTRSSSPSPVHKQTNLRAENFTQLTVDDIPPAIPPRRPLNKKSSLHMPINTTNKSPTKTDDTSIPDSRRLSNKEVITFSVLLCLNNVIFLSNLIYVLN